MSVVKAAFAGADRIGDVIIDDYIRTSEPVVDYLTKYSGIAPGDLDPGVSPHNLGAGAPPDDMRERERECGVQSIAINQSNHWHAHSFVPNNSGLVSAVVK